MTGNLVTVDFYGDTLEACQQDGKVWVNLNRLCEAMGVDMSTQRRKLKKEAWACLVIMTKQAEDGQRRDFTVIDLDTMTGWLFTINAGKVRKEIREKLVRYQQEAVRVLADHFFKRPASTVPAVPDASGDVRLIQADLMRGLVVAQIAQEKNLEIVAGLAVAANEDAIGTRQELAIVKQKLAITLQEAKTAASLARKASRTAGDAYRHATAGGAPAIYGLDPMITPMPNGMYTVVCWMREKGLRFLKDRKNEASLAGRRATRWCNDNGVEYEEVLVPYQKTRNHGTINVYPPEALLHALEGFATSIYPRGAGPAAAPALPSTPTSG